MTPTAVKNKQIDADVEQKTLDRKQQRELKEKELKQERDLRGKELGAKYMQGTGALLRGIGGFANSAKWYTNAAAEGTPSNEMAMWYPNNTRFPINSVANIRTAEYVGFPFVNVFPKGVVPGATPTIETGESKLNFTAERLRAYISAKTGRVAPYDPSDVMFIFIGSTDIVSRMLTVNKLIRLLFYKNSYRPELAKQILAAHGYDYDYEYNNRANTIGTYNSLVQSINSTMLLPKEFPYIARKALMAYGMWMDTKSKFHTVFDFISMDHLIWDEANSVINSEFIAHAASTAYVSLSAELSYINDALEEITGSQLSRDLYPDLRLAYLGKDNQYTDDVNELSKYFYALNFLHLEDQPEFRDIEEIKEQLLNAEYVAFNTGKSTEGSFTFTNSSGKIQVSMQHEFAPAYGTVSGSTYTPFPRLSQDSAGKIVIETKVAAVNSQYRQLAASLDSKFLNSYADVITPDDVAEMTRLKSSWVITNPSGTYYELHIYDGGTEALLGYVIGKNDANRNATMYFKAPITDSFTEDEQYYVSLDYAPALYKYIYAGSDNVTVRTFIWITEHLVPYPYINFTHFNITAMQSLFTPSNNLNSEGRHGRSTYRK